MFRADHATAIGVLAPPTAAGTPGYYGSDTVVTAEHLNMMVEEMMAVLAGAGVSPDKSVRTQLLTSIQRLTRTKLNAPLTVYVATTGNDANDGLTVGTPLLTLQAAWDKIVSQYDLNGQTVTIQLANGTYTGGLAGGPIGSRGGIVILGNAGSPSSVVINRTAATCFFFTNSGQVEVRGVKMVATGTPGTFATNGCGIVAVGQVNVGIRNVEFGACAGYGIYAAQGAIIFCITTAVNDCPVTISGGGQAFATADTGGYCALVGATFTLTGTPAYSSAFAFCNNLGNIQSSSTLYSGSATGQRYSVQMNGIINVAGGGSNALPGSIAGTSATGGQYV